MAKKSETNIWRRRKLWTTGYPSKIAPTDLKLWENAFQTIPHLSFFGSRKKTCPDWLHIFASFCTFFVLFWSATHLWLYVASSPWKTTPYNLIITPVRHKKRIVGSCKHFGCKIVYRQRLLNPKQNINGHMASHWEKTPREPRFVLVQKKMHFRIIPA